ncbi:hypothetical protein BESB_008540 [Besnoitia besnoiti]|uniref:Protein DA1-like domain-containing protein n=1 Tax=Besnoitia besnoiti TaxID=94643 RepID=A0A2A9MQV8_BESBE|nr:hypothetical protein BESB_008540 [Besnoitia besnoiti]PFH38512.1 hypothetical protein BESB_008540 [Besnoitia besnoiti]
MRTSRRASPSPAAQAWEASAPPAAAGAAGGSVVPLAERFAAASTATAYHRATSSFVMSHPSLRAVADSTDRALYVQAGDGPSLALGETPKRLHSVDYGDCSDCGDAALDRGAFAPGRSTSLPAVHSRLPPPAILPQAEADPSPRNAAYSALPFVKWTPLGNSFGDDPLPCQTGFEFSRPLPKGVPSKLLAAQAQSPDLAGAPRSRDSPQRLATAVPRSVEALPSAAELQDSRPASPLLSRTASLPLERRREAGAKGRRPLIRGFTAKVQTGPVFRCTYCGERLRTHKHFIQVWPEFIMCTPCAACPPCNTCHRKAFDAIVELGEGTKSFLCPLAEEEGGLRLCGHCALLYPVRTRRDLAEATAASLDWLEDKGLMFTDDLLKYQRTEAVGKMLWRLDSRPSSPQAGLASASPHRPLGGKHDARIFIRSEERLPSAAWIEKDPPFEPEAGDPARPRTPPSLASQRSLTIPVEGVSFAALNPTSATNIYGRCETEKVFVETPAPMGRSASVPARLVRRVGVVQGLPQTFFLSHLTHELLHAFLWCRQPEEGSLKLDVEEGMCNSVSASIFQDRLLAIDRREAALLAGETAAPPGVRTPLQNPVFAELAPGSPAAVELEKLLLDFERRVIATRLGDMERDDHACYGKGYRAMRDVISAIGLPRTVELTRIYGHSLDELVAAAGRLLESERHRRADERDMRRSRDVSAGRGNRKGGGSKANGPRGNEKWTDFVAVGA